MVERSREEASGLGAAATSGVIWSAAQKWVMRLSGLVTIAILTRVLSPADFGTVTVVMSILPLVYLLADMGFGTYIMQSRDATARTLSTVFWYSTTAGLALTAVLVLAAPKLGAALGVTDATTVIYGIAPIILIVTIGSVPNALLRNRMQFQLLAVQSVAATVASQIAAITLALLGFGVWALVAQSMLSQLIATVFAWKASRWRPQFLFSFTEFRVIFRFGFHVVGVELVSLLRYWAENIIIVSVLGVTGLGYLNIAQRLTQVAQDLTAAAILPVSTVVFAKVRESVERMRGGYFRALGITYTLVIPIMVFIVVGAPQLVPLIFGPRWGDSIVPAQALAIAGIMTIGAMLDQGLFYGAGKPGTWFFYALAIDGLTVAATALLVAYGLVATSFGFVGVALVATVVRWALVGRLVKASWWQVARPFLRACIPAVASAAIGLGVGLLSHDLPAIVELFFVGCAVLFVHLGLTRLVLPVEFNELSRLATRARVKISRRGRPPATSPADDIASDVGGTEMIVTDAAEDAAADITGERILPSLERKGDA